MKLLFLTDYVQPTRNFSLAYVILDSVFVIFFIAFLLSQKKYVTTIVSLIGGILYFLVDFLIFYLATKSREIYIYSSSIQLVNTDILGTGLILLWMSLSYGIMDFAFIWLWLSNDKKALQYSFLIGIWWICCPLIASFINNLVPEMIYIITTRSTLKYHGIMGIIMVVGYFIVIIKNIVGKEKINIIKLFLIGFMAQFLWEFILLIFNIRSQNYEDNSLRIVSTLLQDSLVETNLGMPYLYLINKVVMRKFHKYDQKEALDLEADDKVY